MKKFYLFQFFVLMLLVGKQVNANSTTEDVSGLPNISTRSQTTSGNWDFFGDFLFWYASEETTSVWASDLSSQFTSDGFFATFNGKGVSFDWAPGFRVGVGYNFVYDQWDTQFKWSWFRTEACNKIPDKDHVVLTEFFGGFINGDIANSGKIEWTLLFNMFDWELGRNYWVSKSLSLRPFIGLKGGWINQAIHSKWHVVLVDNASGLRAVNYTATENLKNNFWGIGPFGGINTKWKLGKSSRRFFSLFGDFSVATMWGNWICTDKYKNPTPKEISVKMKKATLGALMLRGFLGIGGDADFNNGRNHFATRLGYEMQIWFNQVRFPTFQQLRLHGDLTLQGATFTCRFDF